MMALVVLVPVFGMLITLVGVAEAAELLVVALTVTPLVVPLTVIPPRVDPMETDIVAVGEAVWLTVVVVV